MSLSTTFGGIIVNGDPMPLRKCFECARDVSTTAKTCPGCGAKLVEGLMDVMLPRGSDRQDAKNWPLRILIALVLGALLIVSLATR